MRALFPYYIYCNTQQRNMQSGRVSSDEFDSSNAADVTKFANHETPSRRPRGLLSRISSTHSSALADRLSQ